MFVIQTVVLQYCMQIFSVLKASEIFPIPDFVGPYSSLKQITYVAHTKFSFLSGFTYTRDLEKHKQLQYE